MIGDELGDSAGMLLVTAAAEMTDAMGGLARWSHR
jgi:hypothetical protein